MNTPSGEIVMDASVTEPLLSKDLPQLLQNFESSVLGAPQYRQYMAINLLVLKFLTWGLSRAPSFDWRRPFTTI
jgi:hypothetical protein